MTPDNNNASGQKRFSLFEEEEKALQDSERMVHAISEVLLGVDELSRAWHRGNLEQRRLLALVHSLRGDLRQAHAELLDQRFMLGRQRTEIANLSHDFERSLTLLKSRLAQTTASGDIEVQELLGRMHGTLGSLRQSTQNCAQFECFGDVVRQTLEHQGSNEGSRIDIQGAAVDCELAPHEVVSVEQLLWALQRWTHVLDPTREMAIELTNDTESHLSLVFRSELLGWSTGDNALGELAAFVQTLGASLQTESGSSGTALTLHMPRQIDSQARRNRMRAQTYFKFHQDLCQKGIIFSFSGYVSEGILFALGEALRQKMALDETDRNVTKRVFSVFVEQVQNIIRYSAHRHDDAQKPNATLGSGMIVVGREDERFFVVCGNVVSKDDADRLRERLQELLRMTRQDLQAYYRAKLREPADESSKGASIGLIEIARRASEPLEFDFMDIDGQQVFFCLKAYI